MADEFKEELKKYKKILDLLYRTVSITRAYQRKDCLTIKLNNKQTLNDFINIKEIHHRGKIESIVNFKNEYKKSLLKKYSYDAEKCELIKDLDSLDGVITKEEYTNGYYNLLNMGSDTREGYDYSWSCEVLKSKMNIERKLEVYLDNMINEFDFDTFLYCTTLYDADEANQKILNYINNSSDNKNFAFKVLLQYKPQMIQYLQENNIIDFRNCNLQGLPATLAVFKKSRNYLTVTKTLFDGLDDERKTEYMSYMINESNGDTALISKLLDFDFKLNEDIIDNLINQIRPNIKYIYEYYDGEKYCNELADKLIRKTKNKEEYRKNKQYVDSFLDQTNLRKILEKERIELSKLKHRELLNERRKQYVGEGVTNILYSLNEMLQTEVSGRTRIRDIDFKKVSESYRQRGNN